MRLLGASTFLLSLAACATSGSSSRTDTTMPWTEVRTAASTELRCAGQLVLRTMHEYDPARHAETFKAYTHVFGPGGEGPLTKGETTGLYPHHKGIFVGWNKVLFRGKRYDFWHGTGGVSFRLLARSADLGGTTASQTFRFAWTLADGTRVLEETRTLSVARGAGGDLTIDVRCDLEADEPVELDGDPHHAGCHIRLAQEFADHEKANEIRVPEGALRVKPEDESVLAQCPWVALVGEVLGRRWVVSARGGEGVGKGALVSVRRYGRVGVFERGVVSRNNRNTKTYRFHLDPALLPCAQKSGAPDGMGTCVAVGAGQALAAKPSS